MQDDSLELNRGSSNAIRDFGADVAQVKALLATEIIKKLDRASLTIREAHARTGIAAADFSRIRNQDLNRFTIDRLVGIVNRLGSRVEVKLRLWPVTHQRFGRGRASSSNPVAYPGPSHLPTASAKSPRMRGETK